MEFVADIDRERSLDAIWCAYLTSNSVAENLAKNRTSVVRAFLNARYYSGTQGQFLSEDPLHLAIGNPALLKQLTGQDQQAYLTDPQQLNSYSYGRDNPITRSDPNGNNPLLIAGGTAFVASVTWDLGNDLYSNMRNPSVPWYSKLTPQDPDAALRYNRDAYTKLMPELQ